VVTEHALAAGYIDHSGIAELITEMPLDQELTENDGKRNGAQRDNVQAAEFSKSSDIQWRPAIAIAHSE